MVSLLSQIQSQDETAVAWICPRSTRSYGDLMRDATTLAAEWSQSRACGIHYFEVDERSAYDNVIAVLASLGSPHSVCFVPASWPQEWKHSTQSLLRDLELKGDSNLFYVLPTSGTTGPPKLVLISRQNWDAFFVATREIYPWAPGTRVALTFNAAFDPFIAMVCLGLAQGATLFELGARDHFQVFEFCKRNRIQVWASTPSLAGLSLTRGPQPELPELRESLFTGEVLRPSLAADWFAIAPNSHLDNLYGPVETTVWVSRYRVDRSKLAEMTAIPIGAAIGQNKLVVDSGEVVVTGPQVAVGYIDSLGSVEFNGIYRTGDLGEVRDGQLHFLGREDSQLKVMGRRVEGLQIESLVESKFKSAAVVGLLKDGNLVMVVDRDLKPSEVVREIKNNLPAYFCPRRIFRARKWPQTTSGKVDRSLIKKWILEFIPNSTIDSELTELKFGGIGDD